MNKKKPVFLYNSLTKKKEEFTPIVSGKVGMYSCGLTVYDFAHLGNLRTFTLSDVLRRVLMYNSFEVRHVMNITDVGHLTGDGNLGDDKLQQRAEEQGKNAWQLAEFYTEAFLQDLEALSILRPDELPKATDYIDEQISLVKTLEEKGYTYTISDGVYFDTSKIDNYGEVASVDLEHLIEGARVEKNEEKKNPTDFALWKFSYPQGRDFDPAQDDEAQKRDMEWKSPWGLGFPGWHAECSAMGRACLGQPFDIHTGGVDLREVHHPNEMAQSEAAYGEPLAHYWVHGEFLNLSDKKMSKSAGGFLTLRDLMDAGFDPPAYRYLLLTAHYRSLLNFSNESLEAAQNALQHLREEVSSYPEPREVDPAFKGEFHTAINNDLDLPTAVRLLHEVVKSELDPAVKHATVLDFDTVLGLGFQNTAGELSIQVQELVDRRQAARDAKDFNLSDQLRDELEGLGIIVEDTAEGQKVKRRDW